MQGHHALHNAGRLLRIYFVSQHNDMEMDIACSRALHRGFSYPRKHHPLVIFLKMRLIMMRRNSV